MKTEIINLNIDGNSVEIVYNIGKNAQDNFDIIENSKDTDIWFHAKDYSSCHVIACINHLYDKKIINKIIKHGALLCKLNTRKLKNIKNLKIIYALVKDVIKTKDIGSVTVKNNKEIIVK